MKCQSLFLMNEERCHYYLCMTADFFQNLLVLKILSRTLCECQTVSDHFVGPDLCLNCLQRLSLKVSRKNASEK